MGLRKTTLSNKSEIAIKAKLCFAFNNVSDWLDKLDDDARKQVVTQSRSETAAIRTKFKERQEQLRQKAKEVMEKKREEEKQKEQYQMRELVNLTTKVHSIGGMWSTHERS